MKMGKKRMRAAKAVAQDRRIPRPVKVLPIAYHEDDDGNVLKDAEENPIVAVARTFRVAPYGKTCIFVDSQGNEHRFDLEPGELDFTSGMVCVKEEEYDPEGNLLAIHNLSHEIQRAPNLGNSNFRGGMIAWTRRLANSPNAVLSRFNPVPRNGKRAGILVQWQAQADSEDAHWLDGRCPTEEEIAQAQREYEERRGGRRQTAAAAQTDAPQEPVAVTEDEFEPVAEI